MVPISTIPPPAGEREPPADQDHITIPSSTTRLVEAN